MIIRAVDWWQPTRRQFGYWDRNTAQTSFEWVSRKRWFALKTKGCNGTMVGIAVHVVATKSVWGGKRATIG